MRRPINARAAGHGWAGNSSAGFVGGDPVGDPIGDPIGDPVGDPISDPERIHAAAFLVVAFRRL